VPTFHAEILPLVTLGIRPIGGVGSVLPESRAEP
jgi:hypothetical protein